MSYNVKNLNKQNVVICKSLARTISQKTNKCQLIVRITENQCVDTTEFNK